MDGHNWSIHNHSPCFMDEVKSGMIGALQKKYFLMENPSGQRLFSHSQLPITDGVNWDWELDKLTRWHKRGDSKVDTLR